MVQSTLIQDILPSSTKGKSGFIFTLKEGGMCFRMLCEAGGFFGLVFSPPQLSSKINYLWSQILKGTEKQG